jgi:2-(1,2-epoxy-1,2-dihydrophenyl)acetyl-CoA isomerase
MEVGQATGGSPPTPSEPRVLVSVQEHRALVTINSGRHNYLDAALLSDLADALERLAVDPDCRVIVLASTGTNFCAGADFRRPADDNDPGQLYIQALRLFAVEVPVVAAVQGRAIGAGVGLACAADFRVAAPDTRFEVNFARLGLHHGFGLTVTLPALVGAQRAAELCFTARPVTAVEALSLGLCDRISTTSDGILDVAIELADAIAASAPLAVRAMRATFRADLTDRVAAAMAVEQRRQVALAATADLREGISAARERRAPRFVGA